MEIVSLIDNTSENENLLSEHGLSLYVKKNNTAYLFDAGASSNFIINSDRLNVDLASVSAIIISHNHIDHIGGLKDLLEINKTANVYIKYESDNDFFTENEKHNKKKDVKKISIGKEFFEKYRERFVWIKDDHKLDDNTYLLSVSEVDPLYVSRYNGLYMKRNGIMVKDNFKSELFMVNIQGNRLVILSACSHNGIINIARSALKKFPGYIVSCIIGGFHLKDMFNSVEHIINTARELMVLGSDTYTCHCTGDEAFSILRHKLGKKIAGFPTGSRLKIT